MANLADHSFVALLSGGLDSTAAVALALESGAKGVLALTFDYGQRAAAREAAQAEAIAHRFGIRHATIALPWFRLLPRTGALLTPTPERAPLPLLSWDDLDDPIASTRSAAAVWVPNRNGVFLNVAAAFAEAHGANRVIVGFNREEATTFPDNSVGFLDAATASLQFSTNGAVQVWSPTAPFSKSEIVRHLSDRVFPWDLLWSCYEGGARMCGRCESCARLQRAAHEGGCSHAIAFDGIS